MYANDKRALVSGFRFIYANALPWYRTILIQSMIHVQQRDINANCKGKKKIFITISKAILNDS